MLKRYLLDKAAEFYGDVNFTSGRSKRDGRWSAHELGLLVEFIHWLFKEQ